MANDTGDDFPPISNPLTDRSRRASQRDDFPPIVPLPGPKGREIMSHEKEIRQRIARDVEEDQKKG